MIGRQSEITLLENKFKSESADFVALFGRRRVGKTYLVRSVFKERITFQLTGLANATLSQQLINFQIAVNEIKTIEEQSIPKTWIEAFQQLKKIIDADTSSKKVIFIDELPWLDTKKSNFIQALEHFWNSWVSNRNDILLIVCGSAASWMINKLINNKSGLHNRVTLKLKIEPFTLNECKQYVDSKNIQLSNYQLIELYMVMGGIPFYWEQINKGLSATQNIQQLCFEKNGLLRTEFTNIFKSLFLHSENHERIIEALAKKSMGLTREEIIRLAKFENGGSLTRLLTELEESGFIRKYIPFGKKSRNSIYQLSDFYCLFYLKFIKSAQSLEINWSNSIDNPAHRSWSGYAFEQVCLYHTKQLKQALGISGIETQVFSWRSVSFDSGAKIDLVIDRRDQTINICEMKFSMSEFTIDKKMDLNLRNKIGVFKSETKTKKAIFLTFITPFGIKQNEYAGNVQNNLLMDVMFTA